VSFLPLLKIEKENKPKKKKTKRKKNNTDNSIDKPFRLMRGGFFDLIPT